MKTGKRIILILLLLGLLAGGILLDPLVRFALDLETERFDDAQAVFLSRLNDSDIIREESVGQLRRYVDSQLNRYYEHNLSYDGIMDILTPLAGTGLPQQDIDRCLREVSDMEAARTDLMQADAFLSNGDYASAIPLYRRSLIADEAASLRLEQAETSYKNQLLAAAEAALENKQTEGAELQLMAGLSLLGPDDDLFTALTDIRRMKEDQAFDALTAQARQILAADGPEAAFRYVAGLRDQAPEEYRLEYLEQLLRHEYEESICSEALSLRDAGRSLEACSLLEDGLRLLDSQRMQALYAEIRATITLSLADIPVTRDDTASARTGAQSTVVWDQVLQDALSGQYEHSLYADIGAISFSLEESFELFAGTVAFPLGEQSDIYRSSATLQVFGDGKLIAEFKDMDSFCAPIPFSIPVTGVRELTLRWTCEGAGGWKDWGRFATVFDGRLMASAG